MYDNVDLEADRAVLYSGNTVGQPMAKAFCEQNEEDGYKYFYSIFDQDFSDAFGGADPSADTEIARASSKALAGFVTGEVRVYNDAGGRGLFWLYLHDWLLISFSSPSSATSFWKTIELPGLNNNNGVSRIWNMADNNLDPGKHDKDLKHTASGLAYLPGSCGVHVTQYQKNEGPAAANGVGGTSNYRFDITLFDDNQVRIGQILLADAPGGKGSASLADCLVADRDGAECGCGFGSTCLRRLRLG